MATARVMKPEAGHDPEPHATAAVNLEDLSAAARDEILEARKQAGRILEGAESRAREAERTAAANGYADGFARGEAEGKQAGRESAREELERTHGRRLEALAEAMETAAGQLAAARDEVIGGAEGELLSLAVALAGKVVGRVAVADAEAARANLRKALERVQGAGEVIVRVNPSQLAALRETCVLDGDAGAVADGRVRLVGDEGVSRGGVRAACGRGEIDATIERQLDAVAAAVLGRADEERRT